MLYIIWLSKIRLSWCERSLRSRSRMWRSWAALSSQQRNQNRSVVLRCVMKLHIFKVGFLSTKSLKSFNSPFEKLEPKQNCCVYILLSVKGKWNSVWGEFSGRKSGGIVWGEKCECSVNGSDRASEGVSFGDFWLTNGDFVNAEFLGSPCRLILDKNFCHSWETAKCNLFGEMRFKEITIFGTSVFGCVYNTACEFCTCAPSSSCCGLIWERSGLQDVTDVTCKYSWTGETVH